MGMFKKKPDVSPIYFVHTVHDLVPDTFYNDGRLTYDNFRTPVYRHTFEEAEHIVLENVCDICEYYYNYAVIEEVTPEFYPCSVKHYWYRWNDLLEKYTPIDPPARFGEEGLSFVVR